jgi:KUP system potassium uptake protein
MALVSSDGQEQSGLSSARSASSSATSAPARSTPFRETFAGHHPLTPVDRLHIYGVLSLIFWSMMIVVTLKYVTIIMRADNKGEGGSLALLALINRARRKAHALDTPGSSCSACSPARSSTATA